MSKPVIAWAGSRSIPPEYHERVEALAAALHVAGFHLAVGCATGADALALSCGIPQHAISVYAAFGPNGAGALTSSAVDAVELHHLRGGSVTWFAGSTLNTKPQIRLLRRSRAVVNAADAGLVAVFGRPDSRGTTFACKCALDRGLPVYAWALGFPGADLPALGPGTWQQSQLPRTRATGWLWVPAQQAIL